MHSVVKSKRNQIERLCREYQVKQLDVFGSGAAGTFDDEKSDLDFLVEFSPCSASEHYERFFGLVEALEQLLGRRVDLVEIHALRNPHFIQDVTANRQQVYAA